jgi:hypothetical protein
MDSLPLRKHTEVLREFLPLEGARVADVGCAYAALRAARGGPDFEEVAEIQYLAPFRERSFEAFRDAMIAIDPKRRPAVEAQEASLRRAFLAAGEQREDGFWFEIPSRLNLLRRL